MNIFASSPYPHESAKALDDKRVIKMILESAQLMSTAINVCGGNGPYKTTHKNHPCSIWARHTRSNYFWLLNHFLSLCHEYNLRFNRVHKCFSDFGKYWGGALIIPTGGLTPFSNCTEFKELSNVHLAYKKQLNKKWANDKRKPKWTNAKKPDWCEF